MSFSLLQKKKWRVEIIGPAQTAVVRVIFAAWSIGRYEVRQDGRVGRFHVRRIVWGREMARAEKRPGGSDPQSVYHDQAVTLEPPWRTA